MAKKKRKSVVPLVPPPLKSRKLARKITTQFHKLNNALDNVDSSDKKAMKEIEESLEKIGGRAKYQEASQLSTRFFSTSKWVIGRMQALDVLRGVAVDDDENDDSR